MEKKNISLYNFTWQFSRYLYVILYISLMLSVRDSHKKYRTLCMRIHGSDPRDTFQLVRLSSDRDKYLQAVSIK